MRWAAQCADNPKISLMGNFREALRELPIAIRYSVIGAMALGVPGAIAGLVIGLFVYAPTAWAATIEVGLPTAVLGAALGLAIGSVVYAVRRVRDKSTT